MKQVPKVSNTAHLQWIHYGKDSNNQLKEVVVKIDDRVYTESDSYHFSDFVYDYWRFKTFQDPMPASFEDALTSARFMPTRSKVPPIHWRRNISETIVQNELKFDIPQLLADLNTKWAPSATYKTTKPANSIRIHVLSRPDLFIVYCLESIENRANLQRSENSLESLKWCKDLWDAFQDMPRGFFTLAHANVAFWSLQRGVGVVDPVAGLSEGDRQVGGGVEDFGVALVGKASSVAAPGGRAGGDDADGGFGDGGRGGRNDDEDGDGGEGIFVHDDGLGERTTRRYRDTRDRDMPALIPQAHLYRRYQAFRVGHAPWLVIGLVLLENIELGMVSLDKRLIVHHHSSLQ